MIFIDLGPVSLPVSPVLLLISVIIGFIVTFIVAKKYKGSAAKPLLIILLAGVAFGRLVFVLRFFDSYDSFWQMIDIRDGDIDYGAALISSAAVLFLQLRQAQQRKVLLSGVITMIGTYAVFSLVIVLARSHAVLPQSSFMQLNGQQVKITDISQYQPTIVNLWASSCEPCRREMPVLELAERRYSDVTFISLNQRESSETVERFLRREGLDLEHVLLDRKGEMATNKGIFGLPVTLFFDTNGRLVHSHTGGISAVSLQQSIEQHF